MKIYERVHGGGRQRGFTLLEALIAFVVLAGGLLAAYRYHNISIQSTADAKIRAEATALAEQKLEALRNFETIGEFTTEVVSHTDVTDGAGSGDAHDWGYDGVDFAASFTRTVTVTGTNPREVLVQVGWTDRAGSPQSVQVSSLLWETEPEGSAVGFNFALNGSGGGYSWPEPTPLDDGTGYGGGKVTIKYKGDNGQLYDSEADALAAGTTVVSVRVYFTGTIESVDGGRLVSVTLNGTPVGSGTECQVDADIGGVATEFDPLAVDGSGNPRIFNTGHFTSGAYALAGGLSYPGIWLDDSGIEVADPYLYSCVIDDIPLNESWQGTVTYAGEQGVPKDPDDVVCIPNEGTTTLTFAADSPETLQLGIVLVDKKNLCNLFK